VEYTSSTSSAIAMNSACANIATRATGSNNSESSLNLHRGKEHSSARPAAACAVVPSIRSSYTRRTNRTSHADDRRTPNDDDATTIPAACAHAVVRVASSAATAEKKPRITIDDRLHR
jgi:hypothetical protein